MNGARIISSTLSSFAGVAMYFVVLTLAVQAPAETSLGASVVDYGALGDGSGAVADEQWLRERGYPVVTLPADHTVIGIAYGGTSDDPRLGQPADGDRWYSLEWSPDEFWHYLFAIARYSAADEEWTKVEVEPGQTVFVENESAYYIVQDKGRLRKGYVPGQDTRDYVAIQEAALDNGGGRIVIPGGHYVLNRGIKCHRLDLCIEGESARGTILELTGTAGEDLLYIDNYGIRDDETRRPTFVSDLTLLGNESSGRGIALFSAGHYTIERVRLRGHGEHGLYINSCLGVNVLQTYFRDCSLRTERWANCFTLDTVEMRGTNAYLWADGIDVGTIKNLCIEATRASENLHRFENCSNLQVRDLYTEVLEVADPSVPIVGIGPGCEQMEFDNCRFTMHRETPKSEYLVDAAPDTHGIVFNRCRVNRVETPYPKIRNASDRGVLVFNEFNFAKIGSYEGAVKFMAPQLSWTGTRPVLQRDPRVETLDRPESTVVAENLIARDSDCNSQPHFVAVEGHPQIDVLAEGGYGDGGGCVRIQGDAGDIVELSAESLRPVTERYVFPFWMMRCAGDEAVSLTSHWDMGAHYIPMPVRAPSGWRLNMILNGQPRTEDAGEGPHLRLQFDEAGAILIDRLHVVQTAQYTPAIWDEYRYVPIE